MDLLELQTGRGFISEEMASSWALPCASYKAAAGLICLMGTPRNEDNVALRIVLVEPSGTDP